MQLEQKQSPVGPPTTIHHSPPLDRDGAGAGAGTLRTPTTHHHPPLLEQRQVVTNELSSNLWWLPYLEFEKFAS